MHANDTALFSFVQLNDTHVNLPDQTGYEKSNEKLQRIIESIRTQEHFATPDFVLLVGDIIHGGSLDNLLPECKLARQMLSKLGCPYYPVLGNHEVMQQEGSPEYESPYKQVFGADRVNYFFVHKGILFVCINNSGSRGNGDTVSDARNAWLTDVLRAHPDMPKIVACHVPLIPMRQEAVLAESFGFTSYKVEGEGTWEILRAEKETVIAVLSGHLHLTGMVTTDDIVHICPSGPASYPCHYAHFTVYREHIDVAMHQVPADLVTPRTNLHGERRHGRTFTDKNHPTPEEYVAGTAHERCQTIPRPGLARLSLCSS